MNCSARIRRARLQAKLTQAELATKLRVQRSAVSHWENVGGSRPTGKNLAEVAVVTGVRHEWLATGRGPMRIGDQDQTPALVLSEFAHDENEARLLHAARRLPVRKRQMLVEFVEGWCR